MGFQIILSILLLLAIIRLCVQFYKKNINFFFFSFFMTIWTFVLLLNWNNDLLNRFGHLLGIERGAMVLVYIALFTLFYFVILGIIKFYKLEQDIDKLIKKDSVEDFIKRYNIKKRI